MSARYTEKPEFVTFPLPISEQWDTLERIIHNLHVTQSIACALPTIWQIEPLVHHIARNMSVPLMVTPPSNLTLLRPYAEQVGIDVIVTLPSLLPKITEILTGISCPAPKAIILVHTGTSRSDNGLSCPFPLYEVVPPFDTIWTNNLISPDIHQ